MKLLMLIPFIFPILSWGQLPKPHILSENGIQSVEIWKHSVDPLVEVKLTQEMKQEISAYRRETPEKEHLSTWFFNTKGYPDSCWTFYHPKNEKRTFIYKFDEQDRVVFLQENKNNRMETKEKVVTQANGNISCLYWNKELHDWSINYTLRKDSLFIRSRNVSDTTSYYFDDRSTGIIGRARYKEGKVAHRYSERWTTTENGMPDSLIITFDQFEDTTEVSWRSGSFVRGYKLRIDGSVIPAYGNNNHWNKNFYKRGNRKSPFSEKMPYDDVLKNFLFKNELINISDTITERRFSNVHPQYYLNYKYTTY